MTKTQILELERDFKKYKTRILLKKFFFIGIILALLIALIYGFKLYQARQESLKIALDEKKQMQKRLKLAKIENQKAQILLKKQEDEKALNAAKKPVLKQKKLLIKSYETNAKDLEQSFNQKKELKTALQLAYFYLNSEDYENALLWSLKANELDKSDKLAWIIFAKSKFALGKKDEAKKAVQSFLEFYGDSSILEELGYILD